GNLAANLLDAPFESVLRFAALTQAVDQRDCTVRHGSRRDDAANADQRRVFARLGHDVLTGADAADPRLGLGNAPQPAPQAALNLRQRGLHVAAELAYLALRVLRFCTHSRSSLRVSRVRGSGGQMPMAWLIPRRMKRL